MGHRFLNFARIWSILDFPIAELCRACPYPQHPYTYRISRHPNCFSKNRFGVWCVFFPLFSLWLNLITLHLLTGMSTVWNHSKKKMIIFEQTTCGILTKPNIEKFKLPSSISAIAFGFIFFTTEQIALARPLGLTHNGIPLNNRSAGVVVMNIDVYFSPNTFFKLAFRIANCGGIERSADWTTDCFQWRKPPKINVS